MNRSYPLHWPAGRPRTAHRKPALFRDAGLRVSQDIAEVRLKDQLEPLIFASNAIVDRRAALDGVTLSTNIRYTREGRRDQNISRGEPTDPGVSVSFDLDKTPILLACDRWDTVADNIAAIAAHIEALRGQERWGVADLRQAFAGHVALPAPEQWWQILGVAATAPIADIEAAHRRLITTAEVRGSDAAMARLNAARDDGRRARE